MPLEIVRRPDLPTLLAACELMSESLGFAFTDAFPREKFLETEGPEHFRVAIDRSFTRERGVVGILSCQRAGQFFGGVSVPCGAVRCVGVAPEARGRGVLRALLGDTHVELREEGVPLAVLYASNPQVYRALGYEYAGTKISREASTSDLAAVAGSGPRLRVEPLGPEREGLVRDLYARVAPAHDGWIDRRPWWWWRIRSRPAPVVPPRTYGFFRGDALEGYVLLKPGNGAPGRLHVADLVVESGDALQSALAIVHSHRSVFATFDWLTGPADPIALHLPVPAERAGPPPSPYALGPIEPWMLRVLDPAAAIARRGYGAGLSVGVKIRVADRDAPGGGRCLDVRVEGGRAAVREIGAAEVTVHARGLASLYGHFYGVGALDVAGLLEGGDPRDREALGSAFSGEMAWMQDHF
jgi:predicted acetyltransferase